MKLQVCTSDGRVHVSDEMGYVDDSDRVDLTNLVSDFSEISEFIVQIRGVDRFFDPAHIIWVDILE